MIGKVVAINRVTKRGKLNFKDKSLFFDLKLYKGEVEELEENLEVEFELQKGRVVSLWKREERRGEGAENSNIRVSKSAKECINEYFKNVEDTIEGHFENRAQKEVDFLKMKRFMITAYNDLYDLDSALVDREIDDVKSELNRLNREYDEFRRKIKYPIKYSFEKIFLKSQMEYIKCEEELEHTRSQIRIYSQKERPIARALQEREEQLEKIKNKRSESYEILEKRVKDLKKRLVDIIHHVSLQKDRLVKLSEKIENFKNSHYREFVTIYDPLSKYLDKKLLKILNIKAYEFDTMLWERAKRSKAIRQFFMDSGIEGTYSSKTFLKYYLRTLDKDKLSKENRDLVELLKYLESISKQNILIIKNNLESAQRLKYLIENIDKDIKVKATFDPLDTLKECLRDRADVIFLDYNIRTTNAFDYIKKYKEICQDDTKTTLFCLFVSEYSPEIVKESRKLGIKHLIPNSLSDCDFIDRVREIL